MILFFSYFSARFQNRKMVKTDTFGRLQIGEVNFYPTFRVRIPLVSFFKMKIVV